jgi:hypothetical protein
MVSVILAILVTAVFVFTFLYQVRTLEMFRVTISCYGEENVVGHSGYIWNVCVEQLSHEELKNATVWINVSGSSPFPGVFNNSTSDGRAQKLFGHSPQPINITVAWDGGIETFLFNDSPIF